MNLLRFSDSLSLLEKDQSLSYKDLHEKVQNEIVKLQEIPTGSVVALIGDFSISLMVLFLACIEKKLIITPLAELNDEKLEVSECEYVIHSNSSIHKSSKVADHSKLQSLRSKKASGLILFTSGSSGKEKASLHNLDELIKNIKIPKSSYRSILFLKFDHIGGINTLLQILLSGGTAVCVSKRDPESICETVEKNQVTLLSVTSSFLTMLLAMNAHKKFDLRTLKIVTFGTEPISDFVLERWPEELPNIKLLQTYGMTETGILNVKSMESSSRFMKLEGEKDLYRIVDGKLELKMPSSMLGYLGNESFILSDGWYATGDLVEEENGHFKILGRDSDWIIVGGLKVSPFEVEEVLMSISGIINAKVFGREFLLTHQIVIAKVYTDHSRQNETFIRAIKEFCKEKLNYYKVPVDIEFYNPVESGELKKKRCD